MTLLLFFLLKNSLKQLFLRGIYLIFFTFCPSCHNPFNYLSITWTLYRSFWAPKFSQKEYNFKKLWLFFCKFYRLHVLKLVKFQLKSIFWYWYMFYKFSLLVILHAWQNSCFHKWVQMAEGYELLAGVY